MDVLVRLAGLRERFAADEAFLPEAVQRLRSGDMA
jgi:hypothetical protein